MLTEAEKFWLVVLFTVALWGGSWLCPPIPRLRRPKRISPDPKVHVRKVGQPWR